MSLDDLLKGKSASDKATLKGKELAKTPTGEFTRNGIRIEIQSVTYIEGGVEVMARAWKNGKQLGFGHDGSVEIERFRFYNPPILVDDPNGDIVREWTDLKTEERFQRTLREDPEEALKQILSYAVERVGKGGNIVKGKVGQTTSTFYPSAGAASPVDGRVARDGAQSWATLRDTADGQFSTSTEASGPIIFLQDRTDNVNWNHLSRTIFLFDTSAIADTDVISSATFNFYATAKTDGFSIAPDIDIVSSAPASDSAIANGDYDSLGATVFGSIGYASVTTSAYNAVTLDTNGIANISKTGISKFGGRLSNDTDDNEPSIVADSAETNTSVTIYYADQAGTSNDPSLIVEHAAPATARHLLLLGVGT